jgi:hypothetical protein
MEWEDVQLSALARLSVDVPEMFPEDLSKDRHKHNYYKVAIVDSRLSE